MAEASSSNDLKKAFDEHYETTKKQLNRLEEIYSKLGLTHGKEVSEPVSGIVKMGEELIKSHGNPIVKDAALIAATQRVEHYEMAGYGSARTFARELGYRDVQNLLQQTLDEEGTADKKLTVLAEGGLFGSWLNKQSPK